MYKDISSLFLYINNIKIKIVPFSIKIIFRKVALIRYFNRLFYVVLVTKIFWKFKKNIYQVRESKNILAESRIYPLYFILLLFVVLYFKLFNGINKPGSSVYMFRLQLLVYSLITSVVNCYNYNRYLLFIMVLCNLQIKIK